MDINDAKHMEQYQIATITANKKLWLSRDHIVEIIEDMAADEETDVRNRWNELAANIKKLRLKGAT